MTVLEKIQKTNWHITLQHPIHVIWKDILAMFPLGTKSLVVEETSDGTVGLHYHLLIINPDVKKYNRNYINANVRKIHQERDGLIRILTWDDNPTYFCKGVQTQIGSDYHLIPPIIIYNSLLTLEEVLEYQKKHFLEQKAKAKIIAKSTGSVYHTLVDRVRGKDMSKDQVIQELITIYRECCYTKCVPNAMVGAGYVMSAMLATQTTVDGQGSDHIEKSLLTNIKRIIGD